MTDAHTAIAKWVDGADAIRRPHRVGRGRPVVRDRIEEQPESCVSAETFGHSITKLPQSAKGLDEDARYSRIRVDKGKPAVRRGRKARGLI
jgi:hypothetical protein